MGPPPIKSAPPHRHESPSRRREIDVRLHLQAHGLTVETVIRTSPSADGFRVNHEPIYKRIYAHSAACTNAVNVVIQPARAKRTH